MKSFIFAILLSLITLLSCAHKPYGSDDHDYVAFKIINLGNQLEKNSIEELKSYALKIEAYQSKVKILGGIHDYINKMSKADIKKYILTSCLKNKELLEEKKFQAVVNPKPLKAAHKPFGSDDHDYVAYKIINLGKDLEKNSIEELKSYALKIEAYQNKGAILGGIHDYINQMSKEDIKKYILTSCLKNKELLNKKKFQAVVNPTPLKVEEPELPIIGGLDDYLFKQNRNTLIRWALTAEQYERKTQKIDVVGGLHDYINTLSDQEISDYILKQSKKYKELNSGDALDLLSKEFKINYDETPKLKIIGGLHDYIYRTDRKTLMKWALTCEYHDRYERKLTNIDGGLHDYINTLSNEKIAEYILGVAAVYPVLNNAEALNTFSQKYNIQNNEEENKEALQFLQA